jgi:REP element-mobilizing transposase RayT
MIAGYHLIWTAYGWWLPNDPRGSSSHEIRSANVAELGALHHGRKRIQPAGRVIREFYEAAQDKIKHELRTFDDREIDVIADTFGEVIYRRSYTCYACAIMPDHVHLLIRKHRDSAEAMIEELQCASRYAVHDIKRRAIDHPVWGGLGWKVFLETADDLRRVVHYIEANPIKAGRRRQNWEFIHPYDGWLPGRVRIVRRAKPQARRDDRPT